MTRRTAGTLFLVALMTLIAGENTASAVHVKIASDLRHNARDLASFNPREVAERTATHIVRGNVLSVTSLWEDGSIHSIAEVQPSQWLRGAGANGPVFLKYGGGRVGNVEEVIIPGSRFNEGEEATVFAKHLGGSAFRVIWKDNSEVSPLLNDASDFEPGGKGYSFQGYYWEGQPTPFTPSSLFPTQDINADEEWNGVRAAIDTWNQAGSTVTLSLGQSADCRTGRYYEGSLDFRQFSCIGWVHSSQITEVPGSPAETHIWTCPVCADPGTIDQVDIEFNDSDFTWRLGPTLDHELDVQGVATHELGHALGLHDLTGFDDQWQTMWHGLRPDLPPSRSTLLMRSLFWGDLAGVRYVYPRQYPVAAGQWLGSYTEGGDLALADLDYDGYPEVIFLWVDGAPGPNKVYYKIGRALNFRTIGEVLGWETTLFEKPDWVGDDTQGAGVAVGDIDRNFYPDLLVAWVNNPPGENNVHFQIGWDLQPIGEVSRWSPVYDGPERMGSETRGLAVALEDVDNNGNLDMVFS